MSSMIPTGDANALQWMKGFRDQVSGNPTGYHLLTGDITAITNAVDDYDAKLLTATTPSTRTPDAIEAKNESKATASMVCRKFAIMIKYNQTISNPMKIAAGIKPVNNTRTPVPAPIVAPGMDSVAVSGRQISGRVYDPEDETKRKKPDGVLGASIYVFVGSTYPSDPSLWQFQLNTTKDRFAFTLADTVAPGSQVWITATWYNRKAETGPLTSPQSVYVQYGLSNAA